jgi:hypothetical protein
MGIGPFLKKLETSGISLSSSSGDIQHIGTFEPFQKAVIFASFHNISPDYFMTYPRFDD